MDQDSTNGSGPDKRNWRERLGIGAKEMPKLSDEFRDEAQKAQSGSEPVRPAPPRGAQPVTSPAPMAPRAPKAPSASASSPAPAPAPSPAPRATPRMPDNAAQEALAEKLRAQRAAAEKLAEQRVQAARDRAEGKAPEPAPSAPRSGSAMPRTPPGGPAAKPRAPIPPSPGGRPKFSFAEEPAPARETRGLGEAPSARTGLSAGTSAPLTPPRPALGADRGQPPFLRPSSSGLGARTQPPYKPVDPSSPAGYGPPPRLQPPPTGRPSYGSESAAPAYPGSRSAPRRPPPALESFPRQETRDFPEPEQDVPRLGRPARGRTNDYDEVFEDDGGNRQRASARDYQSAFGEGDAFAEDTRRSSGPWLLLLAILAAALVAGGGFWYYNTNMKNVAGSGSGTTTGEVPVVNAPPEPAKVAPEAPAASSEEPAAKKKQIYDRIVGEQEVTGGQLQQTEETPVPPASTQPASDVPAAAGTNPIPAPDAPVQGTDSQGLPTVDEPPPLPLPPAGGEQGRIDTKSDQQIAATSAPPEQGATAPPSIPLPEPTTTASTSSSSDSLLPPPPEKATDGAAAVSDTATAASSAAVDPAQDAAAETAAEPAPAPAPKKKQATATNTKKKPAQQQQASAKNLGAEPVVLVPPAEPPPADTQTAANTPVTSPAEAPAAAPEKKKRTIMDLFRSGNGGTDTANEVSRDDTQVASAEPPPPAASTSRKQAEAPPATGSGFVIQLASFRTESDARKEYSRLASAYPSVIGGLQEQIKPTSVGGSTRYQLGLGPLPSRSEATKVCSALITAGESDCIVRGR